MTATLRQIPYYAEVRKADPQFEKDRVNQVEYEFSGRTFYGNPSVRGPYDNSTPTPPPPPGPGPFDGPGFSSGFSSGFR
jgi:hypothetical protein